MAALHVSALHCLLQGEFLVLSKKYSIEEQSIEYCGLIKFEIKGSFLPSAEKYIRPQQGH
jgi:hypothetical protein